MIATSTYNKYVQHQYTLLGKKSAKQSLHQANFTLKEIEIILKSFSLNMREDHGHDHSGHHPEASRKCWYCTKCPGP